MLDLLLFFVPQIIVAIVIAASIRRYVKGTLTKSALVRNVLINVTIGLVILSYTMFSTNASAKQSNIETIDKILSENEIVSNLRVKHLEAPFFSTMPFSGTSEYTGFFTIRNEKKPLDSPCDIQTFDYRWRSIDGDRYVINIDGGTMSRMLACSE
ncbi:hypothetical protein [Shinella zoogloeoides]